MKITLLSTVVAPKFTAGMLKLTPVSTAELPDLLARVGQNLCGHPATDAVLRSVCLSLPVPERTFWNGEGIALAVRPRGGVRGASATGDTPVMSLDQLEAVLVEWIPGDEGQTK